MLSVFKIKILTRFLLSDLEKFIDRSETKTTDVDPSIVGQHVLHWKIIISSHVWNLIDYADVVDFVMKLRN